MRTQRSTDKKQLKQTFNRTERLINIDNVYFYKSRKGEMSAKFCTRASALYDLNSFIATLILEEELSKNEELTTAYH